MDGPVTAHHVRSIDRCFIDRRLKRVPDIAVTIIAVTITIAVTIIAVTITIAVTTIAVTI
jgi:uncharacterized Tic20 family protein